MVDSITGVTSATSVAAAVSNSDKVQEKAKQEELVKAKEKKETDKVSTKKNVQTIMDKDKIKRLAFEYIDQLEKKNDYPMVKSRLEEWKDLFDIDKFIKQYPDIYTEADLRTVMYNETVKLL